MNCLGIDIGTQSLKVVILEDGKTERGQASESYRMESPRPGWAQQDPLFWEQALSRAVPRALEKAGLQKDQIDAIGVAAQLDGCIAVDANCQPLSPCLLWMDRRAVASLPPLDDEGRADFQKRSGLVPDASHMAAKIRWLQEHQEGLEGARFHQPTSYLVERLCGAFVFDRALASTTMLYNLAERGYDESLLALFGIEETCLPRVARANEVAGLLSEEGARLCQLPTGIPVVVGTGDDFSTSLGAGLVEPGPMVCILGTAEVVGAMSPDPVIDSAALVETHGYLGGYFVENPGWLCGGSLAWLRDLLKIENDRELDALAESAPPGSDGVVFLPALSGAMAPEWHAEARACFYGMSKSHGRAHMVRALLEGCAFAMRDVRTRLLELGVSADSLLLLGGGAHSSVWAQMRADLCQVPAFRDEEAESCAIGAALLAQSAIDSTLSLAELASSFPRTRHRIDPRPEKAAAYQEAYERYQALFESLRPMWR
jgi:xylulokinase